ncbi:tail fiber assembly protein [Rahnella laticis]|uniref:tail fiber assembly protein n=1 Tax=Rahnella laticis TaxID=2787622 RepID=UPI0018A2AF8A|nr:tail fiber assembly protein [Rahnella laticis]MBF7993414.1 tail fiber assembly protein [Rahnella laticis]
MIFFYSAVTNAFYPEPLKAVYEDAGTWPDDAKAVTDATYQKFAVNPIPDGKIRMPNKAGMPYWANAPEATAAQMQELALREKQKRMQVAINALSVLQDASDLGIATEAETASLMAWKKYRVLLNRVDAASAPDISWPEVPENVA